MKTIGHKIIFWETLSLNRLRNFFVIILNFISKPFIEIRIYKNYFLLNALK